MNPSTHDEQRERDAISLLLLGGFFAALAVLVLIGTFWTVGKPRAMAVNIGAGTVLLVIGLAMLWIGRRVRRKVSRGDR